MPLYEYRCGQCRRRFSVLFRSFSQERAVSCTSCGSSDVSRVVSLFAVKRSEESRMDDMATPPGMGDLDENDPRSVARWMRRMGAELGEDLGPEFGEIVDRLESGETPEDLGLPGDLDPHLPGDDHFD